MPVAAVTPDVARDSELDPADDGLLEGAEPDEADELDGLDRLDAVDEPDLTGDGEGEDAADDAEAGLDATGLFDDAGADELPDDVVKPAALPTPFLYSPRADGPPQYSVESPEHGI